MVWDNYVVRYMVTHPSAYRGRELWQHMTRSVGYVLLSWLCGFIVHLHVQNIVSFCLFAFCFAPRAPLHPYGSVMLARCRKLSLLLAEPLLKVSTTLLSVSLPDYADSASRLLCGVKDFSTKLPLYC